MPLVSSARMRAQLDALSAWTEAALRRLEPEFATRRQAGFVRECHGDLHLGNLVLIEDRIRAFDCIEFNAAFRWIDTMSEVAFLVMDCASRGHAELGFGFLNAYLEHTGDFGGLRVLRFYLVFRAVVRAKIAALWAGEDARSKLERRRAWADCRHYLSLAQQFAASPTPLLVLMHGLSGSGKSSIARLLAGTLPAIHIRSDVERKRLFGLPPLARTASAVEGGIYNADATAQTYARLEAFARDILEAGFAVIVDATFLQRAQRQAFIPLWPAVAIVHCEAPLRTLRQRVAARHAAATDAAEADLAVLDAQRASREPLDAAEEALTVRVDSRRYPSPRRLAARLRRRALRG